MGLETDIVEFRVDGIDKSPLWVKRREKNSRIDISSVGIPFLEDLCQGEDPLYERVEGEATIEMKGLPRRNYGPYDKKQLIEFGEIMSRQIASSRLEPIVFANDVILENYITVNLNNPAYEVDFVFTVRAVRYKLVKGYQN